MSKPINLELFTKAEVVKLIQQFHKDHGHVRIPAFPGLAHYYAIEIDAEVFAYYGTRICWVDSTGRIVTYE